jgi:hypothetical protein
MDGDTLPLRSPVRYGTPNGTSFRSFSLVAFALLCFAVPGDHWFSGRTLHNRLPAAAGRAANAASAATLPEADSAKASSRPLLIFRYDFNCGGFGDFIKGMVSSMQIASIAGCDFRVDLSRHPFASVLPIMPGLAANASACALPADNPHVFNIVDWLSSSSRLAVRNSLLAELASGAISVGDTVTVVQANLAMSREIAGVVGAGPDTATELAEHFMATFYKSVVDGAALGTFWPAESATAFRVAVHLREGDRYIEHATFNKDDSRVGDHAALARALAGIFAVVAAEAPLGAPKIAFACGDTMQARELLRAALAPHATVVMSPEPPVHIGYSSILVSDSAFALRGALNTAREHHTLASATILFILSRSGFSQTACSTAAAGGRAVSSMPRCFVRVGANGDTWGPFDATSANFLSAGS